MSQDVQRAGASGWETYAQLARELDAAGVLQLVREPGGDQGVRHLVARVEDRHRKHRDPADVVPAVNAVALAAHTLDERRRGRDLVDHLRHQPGIWILLELR